MATQPEYEMETMREIWRNSDGWHIEVGPDRNGLGLVEIRKYCSADQRHTMVRFTMPPSVAKMLSVALNDCAAEVENNVRSSFP